MPEQSVLDPAIASFDARTFRDALGHFASGVTIVSGMVEDEPVGFTCQSFSSVSLDPPLVSFSVMRTSTSWPRLRVDGRFAISVLAADQGELALRFAKSGTDKWAGLAWSASPAGHPLVHGSLLRLDAELWAEYDAGDHVIIVAQVTSLDSVSESGAENASGARPGSVEPLLFYRGGFRRLA